MTEEPLSTIEDAPRTGRGAAIYRNIVMGVLAVSALATVGLLSTLTWYAITDHVADAAAAAEAKRTAIDKSQLAKVVTAGLQNLIDTNDSTKEGHFQYEQDLALFQVVPGGTEYRGLVTAKSDKGTEIPVEVTVYGEKNDGPLFYELDPASSLRLTQTVEKEHPKPACSVYENC